MATMQKLENDDLTLEIKRLIEQSRQHVAAFVNSEITLLYWSVGKRIKDEVLNDDRAEYGKQIVATLATQLTAEFGSGWSKRQLFYCLQLTEIYPNKEILHTLCAKLSWSHIRLILNIKDPIKRDFYTEICKMEKWSVRVFQDRINSMLYERTIISKKPEETIKNELALLQQDQKLSPELVFRDPY